MLRCAKNQNCTHTHETCFGNTAGLPTPVLNANQPKQSIQPGYPHTQLAMSLVTTCSSLQSFLIHAYVSMHVLAQHKIWWTMIHQYPEQIEAVLAAH